MYNFLSLLELSLTYLELLFSNLLQKLIRISLQSKWAVGKIKLTDEILVTSKSARLNFSLYLSTKITKNFSYIISTMTVLFFPLLDYYVGRVWFWRWWNNNQPLSGWPRMGALARLCCRCPRRCGWWDYFRWGGRAWRTSHLSAR